MIKKDLKIFICEDDQGILEVLDIALKSEGYTAITHNTLVGLEEKIIAENPKILLLDLWLQGANGEEALKKLSTNPHLKKTTIVLMSAHSLLPEIAKAHNVDYLLKPFALDDLWQAINRNL